MVRQWMVWGHSFADSLRARFLFGSQKVPFGVSNGLVKGLYLINKRISFAFGLTFLEKDMFSDLFGKGYFPTCQPKV